MKMEDEYIQAVIKEKEREDEDSRWIEDVDEKQFVRELHEVEFLHELDSHLLEKKIEEQRTVEIAREKEAEEIEINLEHNLWMEDADEKQFVRELKEVELLNKLDAHLLEREFEKRKTLALVEERSSEVEHNLWMEDTDEKEFVRELKQVEFF